MINKLQQSLKNYDKGLEEGDFSYIKFDTAGYEFGTSNAGAIEHFSTLNQLLDWFEFYLVFYTR